MLVLMTLFTKLEIKHQPLIPALTLILEERQTLKEKIALTTMQALKHVDLVAAL